MATSRSKDKQPPPPIQYPPGADSEEGNPYIPMYISKVPWYLDNNTNDKLDHQRLGITEEKIDKSVINEKWYTRGNFQQTAKKFRKGACQNCGALTHKTKDCMERPREKGAKWTGRDIRPDEATELEGQVSHSKNFEAKRDRWKGYDSREHSKYIEEFDQIDEERKKIRMQLEDEKQEDDRYGEEADMPGQKVDMKARMTIRNLRLREDTAKYLLNLDPSSAPYDPKTRSMKENPIVGTNKKSLFVGDEFVKSTGQAPMMEEVRKFAWDSFESGKEFSFQANPSQSEKLFQQNIKEKESRKHEIKKSILDRYGGEEYLKPIPKEFIPEPTIPYINNHTTHWGTFTDDQGRVGYQCCHSIIKNSYCTGEYGKKVVKENEAFLLKTAEEQEKNREKPLVEMHKEAPVKRLGDVSKFDIEEAEMKMFGLSKQEIRDQKSRRLAMEDPLSKF